MSLTVVIPTTITPAMVTANTLAEVHATWDHVTTYADAARVVSSDGLSVYESLQASNTNHDPLLDDPDAPTWWARVGASNRWAPFDSEISLPAQAAYTFSVTLEPGPVGTLGLMGMADISAVRIQVINAATGSTVRDTTHDLLADGIDTPYEFFYVWPRPYVDQATFVDLPALPNGRLVLTFTGGPNMRMGEIVLGTPYELGDTLRGVGLSIADYSVQERDQWGRLTLRRGDYARTPSIPFVFAAERLGKVHALLRRVRGQVCLWIPSGQRGLESLTTMGIYTRMRIDLQTAQLYFASLDLEGLAESD